MCPRSLGWKVIVWYGMIALLGIGASVWYNYSLISHIDYATTPAKHWILIGGITSTTITFRIRLAPSSVAENSSTSNNFRLVIAQDETFSQQQIVTQYTLDKQQQQEEGGKDNNDGYDSYHEYGIYAITVRNLEPQQVYYYGVLSDNNGDGEDDDVSSLRGKFQTPGLENERFNFSVAASSCAWTGSKHHVFETIRQDYADDIQLFLHMGDFHYEDQATTYLHDRLDAIGTVLNSPPQAQLYRNVPIAQMWDDHDYLGNEYRGQDVNNQTIEYFRDTARLSYQLAFPHYPLAATAIKPTTNDTSSSSSPTSSLSSPIYQAFTIGTVRFILLDLMSDKTTESIYGIKQKQWLFQELRQADRYDFVVMVSSKPWIGNPPPMGQDDGDIFGSWIQREYNDDRIELSTLITDVIAGDNDDNDGPQNLLVLSGDAHMVAFDKGENTYYGNNSNSNSNSNTTSSVYSFPILQSAALDRLGSTKGGPFSEGCESYDHERTHQYSILSFTFPAAGNEGADSNGGEKINPCIQIQSWRVDEWGWKEKIFEREMCGKIFSQAKTTRNNDESFCYITLISQSTFVFYILTAVICVCLAFGTCLVIGCDASSDQSGINKTCFGLLGAFLGCFGAVATVAVAVVIPLTNGIPQYDLRSSFALAVSTLFLMSCTLFVIFCCYSRPNSARRRFDEDSKDLDTSDAELGSNVAPSIPRPSVLRTATNITADEDHLPEGVILTGGKKLREEGLNGEGVKVAVIDSGVDQDHPGFDGQVKEQNWLRAGTPLSVDDHGTHVAGTVHMMAPKAEIYDYRVFGKDGALAVDAAIAKSIQLATDSGCQVINMSLGGPFPNDKIWEAVQYASSKGVLLVCAAGNEGDNNPLTNEISFPASYKECLSVAAVSKVKGLPVAVFSNSNPLVDVAGIGVDVISFKPGNGYQKMSGTSMASPHVAGLIACLMTKGHTKASNVYDRLNELAVDIGVEGIDNATGVGFVTYLDKDAFAQAFEGTKPVTSTALVLAKPH